MPTLSHNIMTPCTAIVTVGPLFPVVIYRFTSREVYVEWVGMVDRTRNHMSERGGASRELQMSWTSDDEMIEHMAEFFPSTGAHCTHLWHKNDTTRHVLRCSDLQQDP